MSQQPIAINVKNVTKIYKLYQKPIDRLKETLSPSKKKYYREFVALNDISFSVAKGEIIGILGTNGSGKSTILKIITGILSPSKGTVEVNGKISALLELGAGFNQELTGLENIYVNGTMSGLKREEIDEKLEDIIQFSEIGHFINQPVKTYSSGMFARLAFSVSINIKPDILIVDEALAVGDMYFQEKCYEKMKQMVQSGATILFVSHSLPSIRNFCDRALWIEQGNLKAHGKADEICDKYKKYIEEKESDKTNHIELQKINPDSKNKNKVYIKSINTNKNKYITGEDINVTIDISFRVSHIKYGLGIIIYNTKGEIVTLFNTIREDIKLEVPYEQIILSIPDNDFLAGKYFISVHISDEKAMYPYDRNDYILEFEILDKKSQLGLPISEGHFRCKHKWIY